MIKLVDFFSGISLIVIYILFGIIFDGNHVMMMPFTLVSTFVITFFYLKKKKSNRLVWAFFPIIPFFLLLFVSGIIEGMFSRSILYLILLPISSLLSYRFYSKKEFILIPFSIILFFSISFWCLNTVFTLLENFNAEKNINFPIVNFVNDKREKINFSKNKIIVLDFWSTTCGICFEKFPDFERTYNSYKENKNVEFYVVNVPIDRRDKFENTIKILDSIGYKFPKIYATSSVEIEEKLKVNTFPHLIIIKNGRIRYDGMFETKSKTLIFSIESEIEKLLKE